MKIILKHTIRGEYYAGSEGWSAEVSDAMEFETINAAAGLAFKEKLEDVDVVLRYDEPVCELTLPVAMCISASYGPGARSRNQPRQS